MGTSGNPGHLQLRGLGCSEGKRGLILAAYGQTLVRPIPISLSHAALSKATRDIFNKEFDLGLAKLDVKTNSFRKVKETLKNTNGSDLHRKSETLPIFDINFSTNTGKNDQMKIACKQECLNLDIMLTVILPGLPSLDDRLWI
ncbi:hypothetical protein E2I00_004923 [Balaenoptera physalus]|uniref:Uncharacterized protein n=1 Tax=Balaenoptera physalus TaxID=9770 RepID=A0A643BU38_BALPH|nr:hypothetical protein E2I00_004923 [Balaenoptera physalus]